MKWLLPLAFVALAGCATIEPYVNTAALVSEQAFTVELASAKAAVVAGRPLSEKARSILTKQHAGLVAARPFVDASYGGQPPADLVEARQQADELFDLVVN